MSESDTSSNSSHEGTSSGIRKKRKYEQHYKETWENLPEFKGWLKKSSKGKNYAKCKPCDKDINITSGKDSLIKHSIGKFHVKKCQTIAKQPTITSFATAGLSSKIKLEKRIKEGKNLIIRQTLDQNLFITF